MTIAIEAFTNAWLGVIFTALGAFLYRLYTKYRNRKPLQSILNFNDSPIYIVFPERDVPSGSKKGANSSFLPFTSIEDFLAINNIISALILIGRNDYKIRTTDRISNEELRNNIILICSPKSNHVSGKFQRYLEDFSEPIRAFQFVDATTADGTWYIKDEDNVRRRSDTYRQKKEYDANGVDESERSYDDWAVITKYTNPWCRDNKVMMVAGIRGIGTWGAAEVVKKKFSDIFKEIRSKDKGTNFSAVLRVNYRDSDIRNHRIRDVKVLPEHASFGDD